LPEWPILRNGDQGPNVYALQYLLKYHGQNLTADGIFGNQTRTAVMNFQTQKGLAADGQAGPLTFSELIKIGIVRSGQSGDQVRALQHLLSAKYGYTLAVDGVFGSQTDSAVKDFQGSKGLAVDGLVGPQTWQTLIGGNP
jgi:peptidoglycan hydrolase-like protein with peptidoglycan-binding domain